jgi:signal transduction histidine kinase
MVQIDFKEVWKHIDFRYRWDLLRLRRAYLDHERSRHPLNGVVQYHVPQHPPIWLQWKAEVEYDRFGKMQLLSGSVYDVSSYILAQQESQKVLIELEKRNELRNRFLNAAAHEIKTPLSTILTSTELINYQLSASEHADPDPIRKHLQRIQHQVRKMNTMFDAMLILGQLKTNPFQLHRSWVSMASLIDQLQDPLEYACNDERPLCLINEISTASVYVDVSLIRPVMINLLSNAYKYSEGAPAPILRFLKQASTLIIEIQDFGIGISELELADIFETFYRSPRVEHIRGYGVGLSIVQEMVHIHGGHVEVESRLGEGSHFRIFLPDSLTKPA